LEVALVALWRSWGVEPSGLLGHSLGEFVAACVAGVFALEDALGLVALRGRLMGALPGGAMVSVAAERAVVESLLVDPVGLAAHNGPRECVVSGEASAVAAFEVAAGERGLVTRPVATSHAFHSVSMEPIVAEFVAAVAATERRAPVVPFVSNVTGGWIDAAEATDPAYWGRHVRAPVEFAAGLATALADASAVALEVGPGQTLASLARRARAGGDGGPAVSSLPHRADRRGALEHVQRSLGQLWVAGVACDWDGYFSGERRRRVALPTYPFERQRYWLEPGTAPTSGPPGATATEGRRADVADWFYVPSWQRTSPPPPRPRPAESWLVFADGCGVADALADRLRARGAAVTTVVPADRWERLGDGRYTLDPRDAGHYRELVAAVRSGPSPPTGIAHLWTVSAIGGGVTPAGATDAQALGFHSLLHLAQAFGERPDDVTRDLWVVTNGLHDVTDSEALAPEKATVLGPCRVIPREFPRLRCSSVDIVLDGGVTDRLVQQLSAELAAEPCPQAVAYRGRHRWVQRYVHERVPEPQNGETVLRERGVYLITGGLGGLGLAVAAWLAPLGARLVLTGRSPLPPAGEWRRWLEDNPGPGGTAAILRRLLELEALGAEVVVAKADVTSGEQMRAVVAGALERWGAIHGVVHAAGVAGGGLIQLKTEAAAAEVLGPKVEGTLVLSEALADAAPDFMVLFSSNAANVGDFGQVDYCAANAFLDAFAHARSRTGRVVAIDWGPWREIGMAVTAAVPEGFERVRAADVEARGMTPAQGLEALGRILAGSSDPQVIVSPVELDTLFANAFRLGTPDGGIDERLARLRPAGGARGRPDLQSAYTAPRSDAQRRMCAVWEDLLGVEQVGIHDSFFDLGGSSLVAIQLIDHMSRELGTQFTVAGLYERSTIDQLSALVDGGAGEDALVSVEALEDRQEKMRKRRQYQQQRREAKGR
jgi:acyl transferase domain-containing protein